MEESKDNAVLVGRSVKKFFPSYGHFVGKVISYDKKRKFFRIKYGDGDREELELKELREILIDVPVKRVRTRGARSDIDEKCFPKEKEILVEDVVGKPMQENHPSLGQEQSENISGVEDCEHIVTDPGSQSRRGRSARKTRQNEGQDRKFVYCEAETEPKTPQQSEARKSCQSVIDLNIPALPASSIRSNLPADSILHLISAYTFLRSFSRVIYLSPFSVEELMQCLVVKEANTLVDQIHLSLLLLLRQYLENLSKDGVESAVNCLRCRDWKLLDILTWPSYMVAFLLCEQYSEERQQKIVELGILKGEYYGLDLSSKVSILSFICDRVLDTDAIRTELLKRVNVEADVDSDVEQTPKIRTRRPSITLEEKGLDWNSDDCVLCGMDGNLICCDGCPAAYHGRCVGVSKTSLPEGDWFCPECIFERSSNQKIYKGLRGFELLGVDSHERRYVSACGYLFISGSSDLNSVYICFGAQDVPSVLEDLESGGTATASLRENIIQQWITGDDEKEKRGESSKPCDSNCDLMGNQMSARQYVNQYASGASAALAARCLAGRIANKNLEGKAAVSEQMRAFCQSPAQFYWPSSRKKFMEVPRDKCGWCFTCKYPTRKKGCLLNIAAVKLSAGVALIAGGLKPLKRGCNHLPSLAAYMLCMEERLNGLLAGQWEKFGHRENWRKRVENAQNCKQLKPALYELGSSIRPVALLRNWLNYGDDAPKLIAQISTAGTSSSVKKIGSRRRKSLQATKCFVNVQWWRGGKVARKVLDWEALPLLALKRAARQGGAKRISGLLYSEVSEIPRRTVEFAWQARVQSAVSISDLAIQIRYLDGLIRWSDLSVPIGANSVIRDKGIEGDEIMYMVDSSKSEEELKRSLKLHASSISASEFVNILKEEDRDCPNHVWLPENQLPLSLIRDYEVKKCTQLKPVKASSARKFSRSIKLTKSSKLAMILKGLLDAKAPKCETCKIILSDSMLFPFECSESTHCQICEEKAAEERALKFSYHWGIKAKQSRRNRKLTFKALEMKRRKKSSVAIEACGVRGETENNAAARNKLHLRVYSRRKKQVSETTSNHPYSFFGWRVIRQKRSRIHINKSGVQWKLSEESRGMMSYKRENLLRAGEEILFHDPPQCGICSLPYDSSLMYVACEHCREWFHGDALGVTTDNLHKLAAFKCYKCRNRFPPTDCPYTCNR